MNNTFRAIAVLALTGAVSGAGLSLVNRQVQPRVEAHRARELAGAVLAVVPGGVRFEEVRGSSLVYYRVFDEAGNLAGQAFPGVAAGYGGEITLMVGVDPAGERITGLKVLENTETPGLGGRITEDAFRLRFTGLPVTGGLVVVKGAPAGDGEVEAITGATVSSRAVVDAVNRATGLFLTEPGR